MSKYVLLSPFHIFSCDNIYKHYGILDLLKCYDFAITKNDTYALLICEDEKLTQISIKNQKLEENCLLEISVRKGNALNVFEHFNQFYGVQITEL